MTQERLGQCYDELRNRGVLEDDVKRSGQGGKLQADNQSNASHSARISVLLCYSHVIAVQLYLKIMKRVEMLK